MAVSPTADDQQAEILRIVVAGIGAQREFALQSFKTAGRRLHVLAPQGIFDVYDGQAAGRQRHPINPDAHGVTPRTIQFHQRHTRRCGQAVLDIAFGEIGQLERIHALAFQVQVHHRLSIGFALRDFRRVHLGGQLAHHPRDTVANIVHCLLDVTVERELDVDARPFIAAGGLQLVDALHASDTVLDDLRHLVFHHLGGSTAISGLHGNHRRVDIGELADREPRHGHQPHDDQQSAEHHGEDGTTDGEFREAHGWSFLLQAATSGPEPAFHEPAHRGAAAACLR